MKIGIISDTHDDLDSIKKAVSLFKKLKTDTVIHLGDYVSPPSVRAFKGVKMIGILGNNDGDRQRLLKAFGEIGAEFKWDFCELDFDGMKFACYHGTEPAIKDALASCGTYDVVLCGHTHEKENKIIGKTLVLNPGSAKSTVAVFDTKTKKAGFFEL